MSKTKGLPCALVAHVLDAWHTEDLDRIRRIAEKARREGAALVPSLRDTFRLAASLPPQRATALRGAVALVGAATRSIEGLEFVLRDFAEVGIDEAWGEVEGSVANDPPLWAEAARLLLPTARAEGAVELRRICMAVLELAPRDTPGIDELLFEELPDLPVDAADALIGREDPSVGPALRDWVRSLPAVSELDATTCEAVSHVGNALVRWRTELSQSDRERLAAASKRHTAHLERRIQETERLIRRNEARLATGTRRLVRDRTMERTETGPNAPCPCGSGKKTKRCCG